MANFFSPSSTRPSLGPQLQPWHPESKFETFGSGLDVSQYIPEGEDFDKKKVAIAFLADRYSIDAASLFSRSDYDDDVTKHVFVGEIHDGVPFTSAIEGHVVFNRRNNKVVTVSSSLVKIQTASIASSTPTITFQDAIKSAEETLRGTYEPPSAGQATTSSSDSTKEPLEYLPNADGSATLVFAIPVSNSSEGTSFLAYVDAQKGGVVAALDYVAS